MKERIGANLCADCYIYIFIVWASVAMCRLLTTDFARSFFFACVLLWPQWCPRRASPLQPALKLPCSIVAFVMQMAPVRFCCRAPKSAVFLRCRLEAGCVAVPCFMQQGQLFCFPALCTSDVRQYAFWLQAWTGRKAPAAYPCQESARGFQQFGHRSGFQAWWTSPITQCTRMQRGGVLKIRRA